MGANRLVVEEGVDGYCVARVQNACECDIFAAAKSAFEHGA